jgi:hypothetical protein
MGEMGEMGDPGADVLVTSELPGVNCAAGGVRLVSATGTEYICHGIDGPAVAGPGVATTASRSDHWHDLVCPVGFTNVTAAGRTLGCMQDGEEGAGSFYTAVDDCFQTYGARLPIYAEWYATMNNFALTAETGNWEWLGSGDYWTQEGCGLAGATGITGVNTSACTATYAYRCFIPG